MSEENITTFHICKNCESEFEGNYCNNCGQTKNIKRINLAYFLSEIKKIITPVDRGFFFTIKELTVNPGKTINNYIAGKRIKLVPPFSYLAILSIIHYFLEQFQNKKPILIEGLLGVTQALKNRNSDIETNIGITSLMWLINNYSYTVLLLIPIFSLASFVCFNKSKFNFFEHIIINSYIFGQITILFILMYPLNYLLSNDNVEYLRIILTLIFTFYTFFQIFRDLKKSSRIMNTVFTYVIFIMLFCVILTFFALLSFI
ncbi:MAG: DUF3667 domain-containing protein [Cruoricaptor ignavus]|nr:DUF3667 domain-containing protein [Cruoricaptor ignavus]